MEAIRDVGVIEHFKGLIHWRIPNFYDLPQECNTVIRSPHFHYRDSDWYMEVYPDGRRLYSSSGWFGIGALNLNSESNLPIVSLGVVLAPNKNYVLSAEKSHGDGFYCCTRLLPISILKSWLDLFVPEGDLYVLCCIENEIDDYEADMLLIQLKTDDGKSHFN